MIVFYITVWDARNADLENVETSQFWQDCAWDWAKKGRLTRVNEIIAEALEEPPLYEE